MSAQRDMKQGIARYDEARNELEVIRPNETTTRRIRCNGIDPRSKKVFGVEIHGDQIWVLLSSKSGSHPDEKRVYSFRSLSGGGGSRY